MYLLSKDDTFDDNAVICVYVEPCVGVEVGVSLPCLNIDLKAVIEN